MNTQVAIKRPKNFLLYIFKLPRHADREVDWMRKEKISVISTLVVTISAALMTAGISLFIYHSQTDVSLEGKLHALNYAQMHEGELVPGGNQLVFTSTIVNTGQANAFIGRIFLVDKDDIEYELVNARLDASDESSSITSSSEYYHYGYKLEAGQGAEFKLTFIDSDKERFVEKEYKGCYVECVKGKEDIFPLESFQVAATSDSVTNSFSVASSLSASE
jgi:hypothetical protein